MTSKTNSFAARSHRHDPVLSFPAMAESDRDGGLPRAQDGKPGAAPIVRPAPAPGRRAATTTDTSVGREIRVIRRSQGRTLKDLARVIGVTGAQLHRYETGATRIAASRLIAIANALGVGADALIAAGCEPPAVTAPATIVTSDDIAELIELFGTITDPRHRNALLAVARMMALPYLQDGTSAEG